jgi:hypothetical protein
MINGPERKPTISSIKDIPGYEKLLFHKVQAALKEKSTNVLSFAVPTQTPTVK